MWTVGREKEGERVKKTKKKESREVGGGDGERKGKRKKETEGKWGENKEWRRGSVLLCLLLNQQNLFSQRSQFSTHFSNNSPGA